MSTKKKPTKANTGRDRKPTQPARKARRAAPKAPESAAGQTWERQGGEDQPWERGKLRAGATSSLFDLIGPRGRLIATGIPGTWLRVGKAPWADEPIYRYRFVAEAAR